LVDGSTGTNQAPIEPFVNILAGLGKGWRCEATLTYHSSMVVHPVLYVGIGVPSAQSVESLKSFRTKPVVLTSRPIVVLVMKLG
jgi:hypothetical protein